jgi:hypothetical protein
MLRKGRMLQHSKCSVKTREESPSIRWAPSSGLQRLMDDVTDNVVSTTQQEQSASGPENGNQKNRHDASPCWLDPDATRLTQGKFLAFVRLYR